jgi:hypothetical protein
MLFLPGGGAGVASAGEPDRRERNAVKWCTVAVCKEWGFP